MGSPLSIPMMGRARDEKHRAATPLELFFDLVFVVAIAEVAAGLHHAIAADHVSDGILQYGLVFFAIWWAWMSFTWFASGFDTDDVPYRLAIFVQITGALILAAGVPAAFEELDFMIVTIGYVVMRLPMIALWLRAGLANPANRSVGLRMAGGIALVQVGWVGLAFTPAAWLLSGFITLALIELVIPTWAANNAEPNWHPHHMAERYGLLTIIVLGESILAISIAVRTVMAAGEFSSAVVPTVVGGLLIVYSLWWIYFDREADDALAEFRPAFVWGYAHFFIYAAGAAAGAGIAVSVDQATNHASIGAFGAGMAVAVSVAVFIVTLWFLHSREGNGLAGWLKGPGAALLILLTPFTGQAVVLTGGILSALVAVKVIRNQQQHLRNA